MPQNCIFCGLINKTLPAIIIHEDEQTLAFMDIFPLRPAHVLVIPKRHAQYVHELTTEERGHLFETGSRIAKAMRDSALNLDALHFNINDGVAAQQTVPHVHLHLLPRYRGDNASFVFTLLKKPLTFLAKPAPRQLLEQQADMIRQQLA